MRLLRLEVQGFRSLYDITWTPGDLNVVIGPNSSGKSNLLKVLELLSLSARGEMGRYVQREGGIEPLVWDGSVSRVRFKIRTSPISPDRDIERESLTYSLDLARLGKTSAYRIEHELLGNYYRLEHGETDQPFKLLERTPRKAVVYDQQEQGLVAPEESVPEEETLLSLAAGPFTANRLISLYQKEIAGWWIYQDFQTHREAPVRQPGVARAETSAAPDGSNLVQVLHTLYASNRQFKRDLNAAMVAAFGDDFEELVFPPAADQRVQLRVRWKCLQREQTMADLSDGTLRFLLLIAVLANPEPPALIAIDEPETGLHPSMLPIVAEYASEAASRTQVILTTHSAEFLDAFRDTLPTTTVTRWEEGKTVLRVLSGADLHHWLQGYTLGKLYRSGELEGME